MSQSNGTDVLEWNKLIAEFMGWTTHPIHGDKYVINKDPKRSIPYASNGSIQCMRMDLDYYNSWDWLMSVVEKISNINNSKYWIQFNINNTVTQITVKYYKFSEESCISIYLNEKINITTVYKSVINFIKWYNQQNK